MKRRPLLLAVILGFCLGLFLYLAAGRFGRIGPTRPHEEDRQNTALPHPRTQTVAHVSPWPDRSTQVRPTGSSVNTGSRDDPDALLELKRFASRDRIADEYVFSFYDDRDRAAFIAAARKLGIDVLGQTALGNSVRLRISSEDLLRQLLRQGPDPVDYGANYHLRVPHPVAGEDPRAPQTGYVGFGSAALSWLGVRGDNSAWGKGVTIAILDTGVGQHAAMPDSQILRLNMLNEKGNESDPHATAVASLLIGRSGDINGIAPAANILSIRVLSADGGGDVFTLAAAIVEATDRGSSVINISLGSYGDSYLLSRAIDYATEHGAVVVASAGNDAVSGVTFPAAYDGVVAVGAVDGATRHVYFSNRGDEVDLTAPGIGIYAAGDENSTIVFSGTSASAPLVSGTIAALLASDPSLTPEDAVAIVLAHADDHGAPGNDDEYGQGTLNVGRINDRNTSGIYDVAVGDAYVVSDDNTYNLILYVQNRGTEPLRSIDMAVTIDGVSSFASFSNLEPGDTASRDYDLVDENLSIYGQIMVTYEARIDGEEDSNPGNNSASGAVTVGAP